MKIQITQLFAYTVFIINRTTLPTYGMLGTLLGLLIVLRTAGTRALRIRVSDGSFWIITGLLLVWLYGLVLGFAQGNKPAWVIQNFGSMALYVIGYFIIKSDYEKTVAIRAIHLCAIYTLVLSVILKLSLMDGRVLLDLMRQVFGNFSISYPSGGRLFQPRIVLQGHIACLLMLAFAYMTLTTTPAKRKAIPALYDGRTPFIYRNRTLALTTLILSILILVVVNQSKGLFLAMGGVFLAISLADSISIHKGIRIRTFGATVFAIFLIIVAANIGSVLELISERASGNTGRYLQITVLWNDLTFFGHGLGAEVPGAAELRGGRSLGNNEEDKLYGVEMIYLNIFHKFGIFALWIIYSYLYVWVRAISMIVKAKTDLERGFGIAALAMMGYTIVGLGNPLLFGPGAILLHIFALRLLARV